MDFHVGPWLVRPAMNSVLGDDGRVRHVTPKAMEVLQCLAARQGQVVAKEELFREAWPGTFVSDDALTRCIGELRRAFHDKTRQPEVIQTIAKRGYLLLPPVLWEQPGGGVRESPDSPLASPAESPMPRRRRVFAAACALMLLVSLLVVAILRLRSNPSGPRNIRRIAVLPLTDLSGDPAQVYFADGMTEELITRLAQINAWKVISRTSVLRYRGSKQPLRQIAGDLGADAVVEGTVLRSGGRVRITAQLIDAATDLHLWSGSFERDLTDVLSLQSGIARTIAAELNVALHPRDRVRLARTDKVVPDAYEAYLKGWYLWERDDFPKAASYFEQATVLDPGFALAHALLYEGEAMTCFRRDLPLTDRALRALARARALDDTLAEVHTGIGDVKAYWDWDWEAGVAEFRRALELNPGSIDTLIHYAGYLHILARWEQALPAAREALQLDPVSPHTNLAWLSVLVDTRQYPQAMEQFRKVVELAPGSARAYTELAAIHASLGNERAALAAWLQADALSGKSPERLKDLAGAAAGGLHHYWRKRLEHLREDAKASRVPPLEFAAAYTRLGDRDEAIRCLEAAYRERAPRLVWLKARSSWDPLRSDPRFQDLLRRMRFPG